MNFYYILIFIFELYIPEFTNPNLIRFDLINELCILGMLNNVNNTSKEGLIWEITGSIKIWEFCELVCYSIMHLSILIWTEKIN